MAAALAKQCGLDAESAGIRVRRGNHAAALAVRALRDARGLDLSGHTPRSVNTLALSTFDRVVALSPSVAQRLRTEQGVSDDLLTVWAVPDPVGGSLADYRLCLENIDTALDDLVST